MPTNKSYVNIHFINQDYFLRDQYYAREPFFTFIPEKALTVLQRLFTPLLTVFFKDIKIPRQPYNFLIQIIIHK